MSESTSIWLVAYVDYGDFEPICWFKTEAEALQYIHSWRRESRIRKYGVAYEVKEGKQRDAL